MKNIFKKNSTRQLPIILGIFLVIIYLLIIQLVPRLIFKGSNFEYADFSSIDSILKNATLGVGLSILFVLSVVTIMGWWRNVVYEKLKAPKWAKWIPIIMAVSILLTTNYPNLMSNSLGLVAFALLTSFGVGIGEELMYRGVILQSLRDHFGDERKVALYTALIFGLSHITNVFTEGPSAIAQAVSAFLMGYYLYIARRWSGGIIIPIFLHALWDFSLFSSRLGSSENPYILGTYVPLLASVILLILVIKNRKTLFKEEGATTD